MQITKELDVVVLALAGPSFDASNTKGFKNAAMPIVQSTMKLVVDMSGVLFVDSSGLGAILSCLRMISEKRGEMKIFGLTKAVRALFELVRMHKVIDIYNTREEALAAFAAQPSLAQLRHASGRATTCRYLPYYRACGH